MKYEATEQVELPTIYLGDKSDPRRIRVIFPDSPMADSIPDPVLQAIQEIMPGLSDLPKEPALLEVFGVDQHAEIAIDSPEQLEEIARALHTAVLEWRHCLKECDCYDESGESIDEAQEEMKETTIMSIPLSDLFTPTEPESE